MKTQEKIGSPVDKARRGYYDPRNPFSSPYEPAMGLMVIYRGLRQSKVAPEEFPAVITKKYDGDRCDLTVFTSFGIQHVPRVKFCNDLESENTWHWVADREEREVKETSKEAIA